MTKDEAICELSVLYERFSNGMGWRDGNYAEALDIAIEILEAEQTEPQTEVDWKQRLCDMYGADRKSFDEAWGKYGEVDDE